MELRNHKSFYLVLFLLTTVLSGCGLPIGKSLLSNFSSQCGSGTCETTDVTTSGSLEIQPNSSTLVLPIEQSDMIEINGTCNDLGRKNNRILVEVYTGEDESTDPYINNVVSQNCLNTTSPLQSDLTAASGRCLWVTHGLGRIEDAGLPNERIFPQCHNGKFGFSVRIGRVLQNTGNPNYKYLVRFKLRTQEGTIGDSTWNRVVVERNLSTPFLSATHENNKFKCVIKGEPARFNYGVKYTLTKTYTDILATASPLANVYSSFDTSVATPLASVFEWHDVGLTDGVTYNYTLTSTDTNYTYTVPPTAASTVATCTTKRIYIEQAAQPTASTCDFRLFSQQLTGVDAVKYTEPNPYVVYEWGYTRASTGGTSAWIGIGDNDGKTNAGYLSPVSCPQGAFPLCTATGLASGDTYFFAVRAKNLGTGEIGKWSYPVSCRTQ